jgi:hypothetical protein
MSEKTLLKYWDRNERIQDVAVIRKMQIGYKQAKKRLLFPKTSLNIYIYMYIHTYTKKVKLSRYRPGQALGIPGD